MKWKIKAMFETTNQLLVSWKTLLPVDTIRCYDEMEIM
jgi:hypothetical protein